MDDQFLERFSRHFPLSSIGKTGQLKLKSRRVLIAGMGGLGTVSSELLASIGVGYLRIVDFDVVERSNLPRQKLFSEADLGKSKVEVAEEKLKLRNPHMEIDTHTTRIDAISAPSLLDGVDLVIDALDLFSTRFALYKVARKMKIPFLFCGSVAEQANVMSFTHQEQNPCMECVLGNVGDDPNQSCEIRGVHPSILNIAASIQVTEAVKILLNQAPDLTDKMLYIDLLGLDFDKITFTKNPSCKTCGENMSSEDLDQGKPGEVKKGIREIGTFGNALVTSLCGRDTKIIDPEWTINWEFDKVISKLEENYHIAVSGSKYVTLNVEGVGVSLLDSGVATIRGSKTTKKAIEIFLKVYSLISKK